VNFKSKSLLALVLAISITTAGCSAQWIEIALQDLPVLTQMALNIAKLVSAFASGKQANPGDVAVIQNISAQASRDLNLLQSLYAEYKASPSATTLQKLQSVISAMNQNLSALLQSAHISNSLLSVRITAAVNLILSTVNNFAALIPQAEPTTGRKLLTQPPTATQLKHQWNQQVCVPSGSEAFDAGLVGCVMR
jgi:hypothetical protein